MKQNFSTKRTGGIVTLVTNSGLSDIHILILVKERKNSLKEEKKEQKKVNPLLFSNYPAGSLQPKSHTIL